MKNDVHSVTCKGCHMGFCFFFFFSEGLFYDLKLFLSETAQLLVEIASLPKCTALAGRVARVSLSGKKHGGLLAAIFHRAKVWADFFFSFSLSTFSDAVLVPWCPSTNYLQLLKKRTLSCHSSDSLTTGTYAELLEAHQILHLLV